MRPSQPRSIHVRSDVTSAELIVRHSTVLMLQTLVADAVAKYVATYIPYLLTKVGT